MSSLQPGFERTHHSRTPTRNVLQRMWPTQSPSPMPSETGRPRRSFTHWRFPLLPPVPTRRA